MKEWSEADETVGAIAAGLIPNHHPELASARMWYVFVSEAANKGGQELLGKVKKVSGFLQWITEKDFLIEIALPKWNDLEADARTALVDHMLERCVGTEDDKNSGQMKWSLREPEVQEFASILDRYGAWNPGLAGFVAVSKRVNLDGFVDEETATDLNADASEEVQATDGSQESQDGDDLEV
jgi:hypothetical protein